MSEKRAGFFGEVISEFFGCFACPEAAESEVAYGNVPAISSGAKGAGPAGRETDLTPAPSVSDLRL